jgi:hypothetical protein
MRFFFDFISDERVIFDYVGYEFKNPQGAVEFAQEKSQLLKNSITRDWAGWSIGVSSAEGQKLCSLPIDSEDMTFADPCEQAAIACVS